MIKISSCLITAFLFFAESTIAQKIQFQNWHIDKFSFDIPDSWSVDYNLEERHFICTSTIAKEKETYNDCFEGIVFKLYYETVELEAMLLDNGYRKADSSYYTSDRFSESIKANNIKGENWKGIYHTNICGISCKENWFHAAAGQCQVIYFSDNKTTVCITTNGRDLDNKVFDKIISSFYFDPVY